MVVPWNGLTARGVFSWASLRRRRRGRRRPRCAGGRPEHLGDPSRCAAQHRGDASGGVDEGLVEAVLLAGRPGVARVGAADLLKVPVVPGSLAGTRRGCADRPAVRSLLKAPGGPVPDGYRGPVMTGVRGQPDLLAGHAFLKA